MVRSNLAIRDATTTEILEGKQKWVKYAHILVLKTEN